MSEVVVDTVRYLKSRFLSCELTRLTQDGKTVEPCLQLSPVIRQENTVLRKMQVRVEHKVCGLCHDRLIDLTYTRLFRVVRHR